MAQSLPTPELARMPQSPSVLSDEGLMAACGVRIAFTSREGGVSEGVYASLNTSSQVGDELACVEENRRRALAAIGFADVPAVVPNQVHGTQIVQVSELGEGLAKAASEAEEGADAVIVDLPELAAFLNFADCLPLIIVSPSGRFAVVHAGWRGAVSRIASKAALKLAADDAFPLESFNAYIGPHIREECFEAGEDVLEVFLNEFGEEVLSGGSHVSLSRAVSSDLTGEGFSPERIADAGICTACQSQDYFSYRASGGNCGRQAAIAVRWS